MPVMEGNKREENLPHLQTLRWAALEIARQQMQAIWAIVQPEEEDASWMAPGTLWKSAK